MVGVGLQLTGLGHIHTLHTDTYTHTHTHTHGQCRNEYPRADCMLPTNRDPLYRKPPDPCRAQILAHRTLAMPSRTLVGPAGVKASTHLSEQLRSWSSWPTLGLPLLATGLLGTENWGPTCSLTEHSPTNQPGSVPRARFYFG